MEVKDMIDLNAKAVDLDELIEGTETIKKDEQLKDDKQQKKENIKEKKQENIPRKNESFQNKSKPKYKEQMKNNMEFKQKKEISTEEMKNKDIKSEIQPKVLKSEKKVEEILDNRLIIGQNEKHNDYYIAEKCRTLNMAVIGCKGTGKTTNILPFFAEQDISKKLAGVTFIVSDQEMAYALYSICKQYKRKVHLLKPTTNNEICNKFLWKTEYDYDWINEHIINYKEAIRRKEIVIIDMEVFKYKIDAIRATSMLLLQLRLDLLDTDVTQRHTHYLYVDDAFYYLRFLEDFLRYGSTYNLNTILFLESRSQLLNKDKNLSDLLDNYIRNYILLNKLTLEDYQYYKELFPEQYFKTIMNRELTSLTFQTVDQNGSIRNGVAKLKQINTIDFKELEKKSKKIRASLLKEKRKERENEIRSKMANSQFSNEPKPIDSKLLESLINELDPETERISQEKMEENKQKMDEKIQEEIREEEKAVKRKAAENIYNNYESHIEFCDDLFKFD